MSNLKGASTRFFGDTETEVESLRRFPCRRLGEAQALGETRKITSSDCLYYYTRNYGTFWGGHGINSGLDNVVWLPGGEIADAYFRLAIPEWGIGHAEMKAISCWHVIRTEFGKKLVALSTQIRPDGMTRVRAFLDQLEDYTDQEIPEEHIPSFVQALFRVGDKLLLPEDEARNLLDSGNDIRIGRIIYRLLRRLEEPERFEMLRHAIEASDFLAVTALALTIFDQEHKRHLEQPDAWRSVNAEHLGILQDLALRKIRAAAENGTLVRSKSLGMVLFRGKIGPGRKRCGSGY